MFWEEFEPSDGSSEQDANKITTMEESEPEPDAKKMKAAIKDAIEDWICVLTRQLPIDPRTAEDGYTYEGRAIEEYIAAHKANNYASLLSPTTNLPMGPTTSSAKKDKRIIEYFIRSGLYCGDKAESWKRRTEEKELLAKVAT